MAEYQYDKDGNYTGKVLSESEHQRKQYETPERYTCRYCLEKFSKPAAKQEGFFSVCMECFKLPQEKKKSKIEWLYLVCIIGGLCFSIWFYNGGLIRLLE